MFSFELETRTHTIKGQLKSWNVTDDGLVTFQDLKTGLHHFLPVERIRMFTLRELDA